MKKWFKAIALILVCSLVLSGCWDQIIFDEIGFILSLGVEHTQDDNLILTYTYPVIGGLEKGIVDVFSLESSLLRGGRTDMLRISPKQMLGGKIQQVLISEDLAKDGIHDLLELFQRDVTLPAIAYIVIVEGSPQELLKTSAKFKTKPKVSFYIHQLLVDNIEQSNIPNTKIFDFDIDYYAPGLDPVVAMIKLQNNVIQITGCALFSGDKMTGKLDNDETILMLGMMKELNHTDFVFKNPEFLSENKEKHGIGIDLMKHKRKINIDFNEQGIPNIDIDIKYKCNINEYVWDDTVKPLVQENIEKKLGGDLTAQSNKIIQKLQEANCDPIGIGDIIRAKYYDYWKSIDWNEMYKMAEIKVNVEIEIINVGIIE